MDPPEINFVDSKTILVVNQNGTMRQLFVPFKVTVQYNVSIFSQGNIVYVEEVQQDRRSRLVYRIAGRWWPYYFFSIQLRF